MSILYLIFYFLLIFLSGYLVVALLYKGRKLAVSEFLGLVVLCGTGEMSFIQFFTLFAGVQISRTGFLFYALFIALLFFLIRPGIIELKEIQHINRGQRLTWIGLLTFPVLCLGIVVLNIFMPLYEIDSFVIWGLKAKALFFDGLRGNAVFSDPVLSFSHLDYPLLVPLLISGVYSAAGSVNTTLGKLIYPMYYIGGGCLVYSGLAWKLSPQKALLFVALMLTAPAMVDFSCFEIADMPLTFYYAGSILYIIRFMTEKREGDVVVAALMTLCLFFSKNEGSALAIVNVVVFIVFFVINRKRFSGNRKMLIQSGIILFLGVLPFLIWKSGIPRLHENYPERFLHFFSSVSFERVIELPGLFLRYMSNVKVWGIFWFLPVVMIIWNPGNLKKQYVQLAVLFFITHILLYFAVFTVAPWSPDFLAKTALDRLLLHAMPAVLFFSGWMLKDDEESAENK